MFIDKWDILSAVLVDSNKEIIIEVQERIWWPIRIIFRKKPKIRKYRGSPRSWSSYPEGGAVLDSTQILAFEIIWDMIQKNIEWSKKDNTEFTGLYRV